MKAIRILLKIAALPVLVIILLLKWVWIFLTYCSQIFFFLIAFMLFLTAVASYAFGLEDGAETIRILIGGFVMFMIPITAAGMTAILIVIQERLVEFLIC